MALCLSSTCERSYSSAMWMLRRRNGKCARTWRKTTYRRIETRDSVPDPVVAYISSLFLIWDTNIWYKSVLSTWLAVYKLDCAFNPQNPSHLTMSSVFGDALNKYGNQTSAEALFFHSTLRDYVKGLRVLLPDLGLEFSDGSYIGTGAFLTDTRRPDYYLSILCYFDIVKIPPVFSTTTISMKPRGQIDTSRIPLQIQEIINFARGSSFTIQMPQTQPKLSARYVIVSFTKNTIW